MSVQQEHATSETATLTTTESGGVYQSLFDKINLTPVSSIQEIDLWQNSETLADASPDERVTAAIHVLLSCLAKSGENVVKLDKSLLDFHIDDLDQKISKQLDAVMHHPEFQKVESLWRGTWFVVQRTDFRKNVRIELLDISKEHLRQDFDDSPEIIQSGLYRHTYIQEYDTPGGEPVASLISSYEFDNSPQDIALLRNISRVSAASHMPFIGSVGPKFFLKNSMEEVAAIKDIGNYFDRAEYIKWKSFRDTDDSRYVGLVMPRVLGRLPYGPDTVPVRSFNYVEEVKGPDHEKYLWTSASFRALNAQWRKQRELSALSTEALNGYAQAQSQLQRLSAQLDALDPAEQIAMMRIKGRQLKSDPDWRNRSGSILKKQYARRDILKNRVWERSPSIKSVSVELKTEAIRRMKNRKVVGEKVQDIADDLNVSLSRLYHWLKM